MAYIKGDINGDGKITLEDLALVNGHVVGYVTLTGAQFNKADVNNDGIVNALDLVKLKRHTWGNEIITEVVEE